MPLTESNHNGPVKAKRRTANPERAALCGWRFGLDGRTIAVRQLIRPMPEKVALLIPHGAF